MKDFIQEFFIFPEFRFIFSKARVVKMAYFEAFIKIFMLKLDLFSYVNWGYFFFMDFI